MTEDVYTKNFSTKKTPQSEPIPDKNMVANSAGGYSFKVGKRDLLERFLILGTEGGTYYISEKDLTIDNAQNVLNLIKTDGEFVVNKIVEISGAGRALKNDPALFSLAMASKHGNTKVQTMAYRALQKVARTGTHLFQFCKYREAFGGWGTGMRKAVSRWYLSKSPNQLAYQLLKYKQRDGWSHRDLLRLAHPKTENIQHKAIFDITCHKNSPENLPKLYEGVQKALEAKTPKEVIPLIQEYGLTREMIPTEFLNTAEVMEVLLEEMPMTAMIRNLGNMSKVGLLKPMSDAQKIICDRLVDEERLKKARIHPASLIIAGKTYGKGHGLKGSGNWTVVQQVVDAINDAFYKSFKYVEPTGKRFLLGVDVSSSMSWNNPTSGVMNCAEAAALMSLVTAKVEKNYHIMGFADHFKDLGISPNMRFDDVMKKTRNQNFGGTDCALPMLWANKNSVEVDTFVVYTDNETWHGRIHPVQALQQYRQKTGINAKLIVVGLEGNSFTIADPNDSGMLDVVGFDSNTPNAISEFSKL